MLIWVIIVLLTVAVLAALLRPLMSERHRAGGDAQHDLVVYRDQLREVDLDLERGLIGEVEAEAARAEISRRILAHARTDSAGGQEADAVPTETERARSPADEPPGASRVVLVATALFVPLTALAFYLGFGTPSMPDMPHAARIAKPAGDPRLSDLIARVEERLRTHPEDGMGWDVMAPVYLRRGQYDRAAEAYGWAIRILGESTRRLAGLGEASVLGKKGIVGEAARKAFAKVIASDPHRPKARFWLAMAAEQDGNFSDAMKRYAALLKDSPADASWRPLVTERLQIVTSKAGGKGPMVAARGGAATGGPMMAARGRAATGGPMMAARGRAATGGAESGAPGPTSRDIAAARGMSAADRAQMINQMVARLASRLEKNGKDLGGWLRLMRAYKVLGKRDAAREALAKARKNFNGDGKALARINALAGELGLGG